MLFILVMLALAAFAGAMIFSITGFATPVPVHLALASGAMPLIAGAMMHFAPVLTRSAPTKGAMRFWPLVLLVAGLLAYGSFLLPAPVAPLREGAATLGIVGAAVLAAWMVRLSRKSLGGPHPGIYWYIAALVCLLLALITVLFMQIWPGHYLAWRRFHMHLNALGFIGITAIGTLQVLLPTALGRPDADATRRLRDDLKWVLAGTILVAAGAAWLRVLILPGLLLWLFPLWRLARGWWNLYTAEPSRWNGNATALVGALVGFVLSLLLGAAHGSGLIPAANAGVAYLFAFLLPLVTGAASYLLPLWLRPGKQTEWHARTRQALAHSSVIRATLFIVAGGITTWWGAGVTWPAAALALLLFVVRLRRLGE